MRVKTTFLLTSLLAAGAFQASMGLARPKQAESSPSAAVSEPGKVSRSVRVLDFSALAGTTTIVFRYVAQVPGAGGQAEIVPDRKILRIHAAFTNLPPASRLGAEYLTYVLWKVTPEGRLTNLGEVELLGTEGRLNTKALPGRFGLIVTAEAYLAVSQPSKTVVFEADVAPGAFPSVPLSQTTCQLLAVPLGAEVAPASSPATPDPAAPLVLEEARRALATARQAGAEDYAPDTLATAEQLLRLAQDQQAHGVKLKDVWDTGSEAVFIAEDARVLAVTRQKRAAQARTNAEPAP
ncbi:MAG TPA: hypothetical protein VI455_11670 [Terriglobia bacterium]